MGFWRFQGPVILRRPRPLPGHAKSLKKPLVFKLFQKKMVLALEFWGPPFHFLRNASANLLVWVAKLGATTQLGLQRHLASKGAPKGSQGVPKCPKGMQRVQKISRKASEIIEKSTETSAKQCISKEKFKQSLKVHTKCAKSVKNCGICQNIASGGGPPPRFRNNILTYRSLWAAFCTLCVYF